MNGCVLQRFYVRWRTLNPDVTIRAAFLSVPDKIVMTKTVKGSVGWRSGDGCGQPGLQFASVTASNGANLADVALSIQQWTAAG